MPYLESVLDVYELVLQKSTNLSGNAASKVKQEILNSLGNALNQLNSFKYKWMDDGCNEISI